MREVNLTLADVERLFEINETAKLQLENIISTRLLAEALARVEVLEAQVNGGLSQTVGIESDS